MSRLSDF